MSKHPTFAIMVVEAVRAVHVPRKGASRQAITKYIVENFAGLNIENRRKNFMASMRMTLRKLCEKGILSKITTQRFKIVRPPLRGKKARASPNKKSSQRAESKAKNKKSSADKTRSRKVNPIKPKQARAAGTRSTRASKRRATRTSTLSPTRSSPRITKRNSTRAERQVTTRRSTRNSS